MKKILILLSIIAIAAVSCEKDSMPEEAPQLEVNANNISGQWELVEWNGSPLNSDTYFYVDFIRKDREFVIYQNFDSIGDLPHKVEGNYNIEIDIELGAILVGNYKYDGGMWSHDYEVNNLTKDSMEWVAVDDPSFTQKFERCEIPAEIKK